MSSYKRSGNKWCINEILALQREYELLEMTISEIAIKHQRGVKAILCKLEQEGFIENWPSARGYTDNLIDIYSLDSSLNNSGYGEEDENSEDENSEEENSEVNELSDRIWRLETNMNEIGGVVKKMLDIMGAKRKRASTRMPLRSASCA